MKFRKKPVVIEAEQYSDGQPVSGVCFFQEPVPNEIDCLIFPHVHTLEGPLKVSNGDWIITGIKGERYPCKPDIFDATYEKVEP